MLRPGLLKYHLDDGGMFPAGFAPTTVKMVLPVVTIYDGSFAPDEADPVEDVRCDWFYEAIELLGAPAGEAFAQCVGMVLMGRWAVGVSDNCRVALSDNSAESETADTDGKVELRLPTANGKVELPGTILEQLRGLTGSDSVPTMADVWMNAQAYLFRLQRRDAGVRRARDLQLLEGEFECRGVEDGYSSCARRGGYHASVVLQGQGAGRGYGY